ncbi:MlaD family protein [Nocardioides sp. NBC_00163]|uniref:MlaD family protein n=1 Tax=Nocardioides sp. NBC_00163 TaxID=2975999 RepID=UPI00324D0881
MLISKATAISATVVVGAATAVTGVNLMGTSADRTELVGYFKDASPLEVGNEVRTSGVQVGKVKSIKLEKGVARVTLDLDEDVLPVHEDAKLLIQPINVLGENYVSIEPGKESSPYLTNNTVPLKQTDSAVNLQDVLDTLDDPTSTALAALVSTLGEGTMNGGGQKMADALEALAPLMENLDQVGAILESQNKVLTDLVAKADPVAASLTGENGKQLDLLISRARETLDALADEQAALEATIAELPATLKEAQRTLTSLETVSETVTPTLKKARPVTRDLAEIADEINRFSPYADPAFNAFGPLFAELDALLKKIKPITEDLRASGDNLRTTASELRPVGDELLDEHLGDLMSFVTKWALSTNSRDGLSHYFRGLVHVTPEALNSLVGAEVLPNIGTVGGQGSGPSADGLPDIAGPLVGGVTDPLNGVTEGATGATDGLNDAVGGLTGGKGNSPDNDPNSATGLTSSQEQNLLDQLIGGHS